MLFCRGFLQYFFDVSAHLLLQPGSEPPQKERSRLWDRDEPRPAEYSPERSAPNIPQFEWWLPLKQGGHSLAMTYQRGGVQTRLSPSVLVVEIRAVFQQKLNCAGLGEAAGPHKRGLDLRLRPGFPGEQPTPRGLSMQAPALSKTLAMTAYRIFQRRHNSDVERHILIKCDPYGRCDSLQTPAQAPISCS